MTRFADLSQRAQTFRLRAVAVAALRDYPVTVSRIRLLHHGFNTTFRVDTEDGRKFALRINVNSRRTEANLAAEAAWLELLTNQTGLRVPQPQPTRGGELVTHVHFAGLDRTLPAVLFSWLPGRLLDAGASAASDDQMREVGRAMATLHEHALTMRLPDGAALPRYDAAIFGDRIHLTTAHRAVDADAAETFRAALDRVRPVFAELWAADTPRPLHLDLHNWNLKWYRNRLIVFDFDDSGIGVPIQDIAIAAYYRRAAGHTENPLLEGYQEIRALPAYRPDQLEALVAERNLILVNDVVVNTTADIRELTPRYVRNSARKLRGYLESGVYSHDVPGVER
ncbi:MAG: phosphotransferase enzyme family protein [Nocardioides sp.]